MIRLLFVWNTHVGPFYIGRSSIGYYHPVFDDLPWGNYARPEQVAEDLAGGHIEAFARGIDTAELNIPADLSAWQRVD